MNALLKLFGYSMTDINFEYSQLTEKERALVTEEEFNEAVQLYKDFESKESK